MRTHFAILLGSLLLATGTAHAQSSPLKLDVKQLQKIDNAGKTGDKKTQTRTLDIVVTNLSREPLNATIKYWFFSRDLKSSDETVFQKGSKTAALPPNLPIRVQSETITATYTEEHVEIEKSKSGKGGGKSGKNKSQAKKVAASGDRITGYAVQVLLGATVAADYYSAPSLKQKLTSSK